MTNKRSIKTRKWLIAMANEPGIVFWEKEDGKKLLTHGGGLTQADVDFLRSFEVGDRVIAFKNTRRDNDRAHHLKIMKARRYSDSPPLASAPKSNNEASI